MKILHVFPFFSIKRGGGATWLISEIAKAQSKSKKILPSIHTGSYQIDPLLIQNVSNVGVKVIVSKSFFNKIYLHFMPTLIFSSFVIVKKTDLIHFHVLRSFQNVCLWVAAIIYKKPYIIDAHGSLPRHSGRKKYKKILFDIFLGRLMIRKASCFVAENEMSFDECLSFGVPESKIQIVRPPFPIEEFQNIENLSILKNEFGIDEKFKIILFFGRLHKIKGIDLIIEGFNEICKKRNDLKLVIMGPDEGEYNSLSKLVSELNIEDKVVFTGYISGIKKLSIIKESQICIQSSRYEQGAGAPFEAVLCGTPILVSDNSGAGQDVKRIDAGYLFNYANKVSLADNIDYVLNNYEKAIEKTIVAADTIKNELSFNTCINNYYDLYKKII
jgi:glycosyltransferase involved in cell wall biosynthesis